MVWGSGRTRAGARTVRDHLRPFAICGGRSRVDCGAEHEGGERAKQLGYTIIEEEVEVGINAIAAPIVPPGSLGGRAVGTVSIVVPSAPVTSVCS